LYQQLTEKWKTIIKRATEMKGPYELYVDGAAKGNPGEAGIGAILLDGQGNTIFKLSRYIGRATNNQAEYRGLILGLEETLAMGGGDVTVFTDSELLERQIMGRYRVKDQILRRYHSRVCDLLKSFRSYRIERIPREENREADRLASQAANKREEPGVRSQESEVEMKRKPAKVFQDLIVWQKAHQLVLSVYRITESFPRKELYGLTSQFRRTAVSIPANIAEGFRKTGKPDKYRFMNIAQGSLEECRYYLILAKELGYANTDGLVSQLEEVSKLLDVYSKSILASDT